LPKPSTKRLYFIPILSKSLDVLETLQKSEEPMSLETVFQRTHISKTTVYRILKTLVHRGYLAQSPEGLYRVAARPRKVCFGLAQQSPRAAFCEAVRASLEDASKQAGVELLVFENRFEQPAAVQIAEELIRSRVDLVIEFLINPEVAPVIADRIARAGIPLIGVGATHPHSTYFGVDNFRAGMDAGTLLAEYAIEQWNYKVDSVLALDVEGNGTLIRSRATGAFQGILSRLPEIPGEKFVRLDGRGSREASRSVLIEFLQRHPKDRHILIAAATDASALGALDGARVLKREKHVALVGQECIPEALEEMKRENSPWVGSVSYEIATYGPRLIQLGLSLLRGAAVSPYNFVDHRVITAKALRSAELAAAAAPN